MSDYEIGYGKPPKHTRFKKGVCPNPRGRGHKIGRQLSDLVLDVMREKTRFREKGKHRSATRAELAVRRHIADALKGDIGSAALVLKLRQHAQRQGDVGPQIVIIRGGLPKN